MAGDPVAVIGAGGHGRVVAGALAASGTAVAGFYDDDPELWGREIGDSIVLGPILDLARSATRRAVVAIGDNHIRKRIAETFDVDWVTVVHPYSWVDTSVDLGPGTVVAPGAVVQPGAVVGAGAVALHDVEPEISVVGVPAAQIRR